jgi:hypothetical protein
LSNRLAIAGRSSFGRIPLIHTGFFRPPNDTGGDKFGFLLLSAGRRFILRADAARALAQTGTELE